MEVDTLAEEEEEEEAVEVTLEDAERGEAREGIGEKVCVGLAEKVCVLEGERELPFAWLGLYRGVGVEEELEFGVAAADSLGDPFFDEPFRGGAVAGRGERLQAGQ